MRRVLRVPYGIYTKSRRVHDEVRKRKINSIRALFAMGKIKRFSVVLSGGKILRKCHTRTFRATKPEEYINCHIWESSC